MTKTQSPTPTSSQSTPPSEHPESNTGSIYALIRSFATHKTAHNLLMLFMLIGGSMALYRIHTRFFPDLRLPFVSIQVTWPGASAEAVEKQILNRLEPSIRSLPDINTVRGIAVDYGASILVEYHFGTDMQEAINDLKRAVERAPPLPEDAEEPEISRLNFIDPVTSILLRGEGYSDQSLRFYARQLRDVLFSSGITSVKFHGLRKREIVINLIPEVIERYEIRWAEISQALRDHSREIPVGTLEGVDHQKKVLIGVSDVTADSIATIPLRTTLEGDILTIGDVAQIAYGYQESNQGSLEYFSHGQPAIILEVGRSGDEDTLILLDRVKKVLDGYKKTLPPSLHVSLYQPAAELVEQRLLLLADNGFFGLFLVLIILFIFLNVRVAFWVALGIPASLLATFIVMTMLGQTLNMMTMFALIMTIGIVVDDAIVVGEHSVMLRERGMSPEKSAIRGAYEMIKPVTISMLTTLFAFTPILFIGGIIGQILGAVPIVVISVLICSFVECFLILPGHLYKTFQKIPFQKKDQQGIVARKLNQFIDGPFKRWVRSAYRNRYVTASWLFGVFLLLGIAPLAGGYLKFNFFPSPEGEAIFVDIIFLPAVSEETVKKGILLVEETASQVQKELVRQYGEDQDIIKNSVVIVGGFTRLNSGLGRSSKTSKSGQVMLELIPGEERKIRNKVFLNRWREKLPAITGISSVTFTEETSGPPGEGVNLTFKGDNLDTLEKSVLVIQEKLSTIFGLSDIKNSLSDGQEEVILRLNQQGIIKGFQPQSVGYQARTSIQGEETMTIVDGEDEITVRLRQEKRGDLDHIVVFSPRGQSLALTSITDQEIRRRYGAIEHLDGSKQITVSASIDTSVTVLSEVMEALVPVIDYVEGKYHVTSVIGGQGKDEAETISDMKAGLLIGLLSMFLTLCWAFGRYVRPILILLIIPFGLMGGMIWHLLLGFDLTVISLIALLGLSGILVNGSIILTMQVDRFVEKGYSLEEALIIACQERFRPIFVTSITTVAGLLPILFETSLQASFLKPIAITLSGGVMVSLFVLFFLVPCSIGIFEDIRIKMADYFQKILKEFPSTKSLLEILEKVIMRSISVVKKGIRKLRQWTSQDDRQA